MEAKLGDVCCQWSATSWTSSIGVASRARASFASDSAFVMFLLTDCLAAAEGRGDIRGRELRARLRRSRFGGGVDAAIGAIDSDAVRCDRRRFGISAGHGSWASCMPDRAVSSLLLRGRVKSRETRFWRERSSLTCATAAAIASNCTADCWRWLSSSSIARCINACAMPRRIAGVTYSYTV
jgi:hypothetical protein